MILLGGVWIRKELRAAIAARAAREGKPIWKVVAEALEREFLTGESPR